MPAAPVLTKRLQLLLLVAAFALPVLAALLLNSRWSAWRPGATRNFGTLIEPVLPLADLGLAEPGAAEGRGLGRWTVLWLPPAAGSCAETIDLLRRVRLAEGRELERVLVAFPADCSEAAAGDQLKLDAAASATLRQRLPDGGQLLLLDPYGNAMLRYPAQFDANHLKKDLARLLRYSKAGKA